MARIVPAVLGLGICMIALGEAATVAASSSVGTTELVVKQVRAYQDVEFRELVVNEDVFVEDEVTTAEDSAVRIVFSDGTNFSMGPNARVALKNIPAAHSDTEPFVLEATEGVFKFVSGNLRSEAYQIETPTATIGVRGTVVPIIVRADGTTELAALSGAAIPCADRCVVIERGQYCIIDSDGRISDPTSIPEEFYESVRRVIVMLYLAGGAEAGGTMRGSLGASTPAPQSEARATARAQRIAARVQAFQRAGSRAGVEAGSQAEPREEPVATPLAIPAPPTIFLLLIGIAALVLATGLRRERT